MLKNTTTYWKIWVAIDLNNDSRNCLYRIRMHIVWIIIIYPVFFVSWVTAITTLEVEQDCYYSIFSFKYIINYYNLILSNIDSIHIHINNNQQFTIIIIYNIIININKYKGL